MPEGDEQDRFVRKLAIEHAETRWLTLRLDDDVKEIRTELKAVREVQREHTQLLDRHTELLDQHTATLDQHTATLDQHTDLLQEHTARFDSVDAQLRSLTQLVGEVLERLPAEPSG